MTKIILCACLLVLGGCISVNSTIQGCSPEGRQTVKSDSDMTPTTKTGVTLPVAVGAQPNATATGGQLK